MKNPFIESKKKSIVRDTRFKHVMALSLNSATNYKDGLIRCIISRSGEDGVAGQIYKSVLHLVKETSPGIYKITSLLKIKNFKHIISKISKKSLGFLGLEDPDIYFDEKAKKVHVYFSIVFIDNNKNNKCIHLGHAEGNTLRSLTMTMPVLMGMPGKNAKELSISPENKKRIRLNLVESSDKKGEARYSTIRIAVAKNMSEEWKFGKTVFHPHKSKLSWIAGHASPGPLLSQKFIHVGDDLCLGFINGCVKNKIRNKKTYYGEFSVGLFIYNYEKGVIEWVSPKPLIQDSQRGKIRPITFASQFVQISKEKGVIYAHIDDSFVRKYSFTVAELKNFLPKRFVI